MKEFEMPKLLAKDTYEMSNGASGPSYECGPEKPPGCDASAIGSGWCSN